MSGQFVKIAICTVCICILQIPMMGAKNEGFNYFLLEFSVDKYV